MKGFKQILSLYIILIMISANIAFADPFVGTSFTNELHPDLIIADSADIVSPQAYANDVPNVPGGIAPAGVVITVATHVPVSAPNVRNFGAASGLVGPWQHIFGSDEPDNDRTPFPSDTDLAGGVAISPEVLNSGKAGVVFHNANTGSVIGDFTVTFANILGIGTATVTKIFCNGTAVASYVCAAELMDTASGIKFVNLFTITAAGVIGAASKDIYETTRIGNIVLGDPDNSESEDRTSIPLSVSPVAAALALNFQATPVTPWKGLAMEFTFPGPVIAFAQFIPNNVAGFKIINRAVTINLVDASNIAIVSKIQASGVAGDWRSGVHIFSPAGAIVKNLAVANALSGANIPTVVVPTFDGVYLIGNDLFRIPAAAPNQAGLFAVSSGIPGLGLGGFAWKDLAEVNTFTALDPNSNPLLPAIPFGVFPNVNIAVVKENTPIVTRYSLIGNVGNILTVVSSKRIKGLIPQKVIRRPYAPTDDTIAQSVFIAGHDELTSAADLHWILVNFPNPGDIHGEQELETDIAGFTDEFCFGATAPADGKKVTCHGKYNPVFTTTWDLTPDSVPEFSLSTLLLAILITGGLLVFVIRRRYK